MPSNKADIIDELSKSISTDVGNSIDKDLDTIQSSFDKTLDDALKSFNSETFDEDGFIKRMRDFDTGDKNSKDTMKHVLNNIRSDYINIDTMNQSELMLRRDIYNICTQMPEMHDVINVVRDGIVECNVATGEVSRTLHFDNYDESEAYETQVRDLENKHELLLAIKNFIVPKGLMNGEMYIHVIPYSKVFAELEALHDSKYAKKYGKSGRSTTFKESIPSVVFESFHETTNLLSEDNVSVLLESVNLDTKIDTSNTNASLIENYNKSKEMLDCKKDISMILENIEVSHGTSEMLAEYGYEGYREFMLREYKESCSKKNKSAIDSFMESQINYVKPNDDGMFKDIDQDDVDTQQYDNIKGCYIKYMDGLRMVPIRVDRRVIGYYYVTTTFDLQTNKNHPNGIIDLSFKTYMRDKNMVDQLANIIIDSFDKKTLHNNVKLKNEIVDIVMAHKFTEGKLSFIYIPENEIVRIVLNEDEDGKGHSILEPTIFPARMYLMLTLYNMLYTLNNNTTRVHYVKSSGLNKDYAAQVERSMRKFQSRRITIDDIYSYSGVINKIGGMGEMVLPAGRNDYKALETDTIEAVPNPISIEFLEQQRRQAISGTGAPHLLVINAIDEVDFAKTLEMANTRFLSTVASYKIDFNRGMTLFYRKILKYSTDLDDEVINSFRFQFNPAKQQEVNITSEMLTNFENALEACKQTFFTKQEMEDENGNPTPMQMHLRRKLGEKYFPDFINDEMEEMIKEVKLLGVDDVLTNRTKSVTIDGEDLKKMGENE